MPKTGGLHFLEAMAEAKSGTMVTRASWLLQGIDRCYVRSRLDGKIARYERPYGASYELTEEDMDATDWQAL